LPCWWRLCCARVRIAHLFFFARARADWHGGDAAWNRRRRFRCQRLGACCVDGRRLDSVNAAAERRSDVGRIAVGSLRHDASFMSVRLGRLRLAAVVVRWLARARCADRGSQASRLALVAFCRLTGDWCADVDHAAAAASLGRKLGIAHTAHCSVCRASVRWRCDCGCARLSRSGSVVCFSTLFGRC
jgi:hypothetical protein